MFFLVIALGISIAAVWAAWLESEVFCPACGYYCTGGGGVFCIDKPAMRKNNDSR